ncbi:MAG: hypothetical protein WC805_00850 [Patescibacteria group bacterium]|jgi:hypothetical protein
MEMRIERGLFPVPHGRKVESTARTNRVRENQDTYDKTNASGQREAREKSAQDSLRISEEYKKLKEAQDEK